MAKIFIQNIKMTAGQLKIAKFYLSDWYSIKKKKKKCTEKWICGNMAWLAQGKPITTPEKLLQVVFYVHREIDLLQTWGIYLYPILRV